MNIIEFIAMIKAQSPYKYTNIVIWMQMKPLEF
jgi:hypothetical protein